ncbi:hypothetical protein GCM10010294_59070 [Streptomyces griseoloalbus]|nr:hypothetical protein GCM10010294_59070 [Streptomyces griseoloalbus]
MPDLVVAQRERATGQRDRRDPGGDGANHAPRNRRKAPLVTLGASMGTQSVEQGGARECTEVQGCSPVAEGTRALGMDCP